MTEELRNRGERRQSRWSVAVWTIAALLLVVPLVVMQFTDEMNWDLADFTVFGAMLAVAAVTCELAVRMTRNSAYRAAVGVAVAAAFILVWMNLAVGVIGTEDNPLNLMYGGVLGIALVGAVIARFRPPGMARVLVATAVAQAGVAVIAQVAGHFTWVLTAIYVALWLTSAWLFQSAARHGLPAPTP